ncbi:hypothetical protein, partial [Brucella oryzae]|uniref:hypothetical protein n=1 Tax=Brucella oryzae TaxID=335286 RepID=UPI001ABFD10D
VSLPFQCPSEAKKGILQEGSLCRGQITRSNCSVDQDHAPDCNSQVQGCINTINVKTDIRSRDEQELVLEAAPVKIMSLKPL